MPKMSIHTHNRLVVGSSPTGPTIFYEAGPFNLSVLPNLFLCPQGNVHRAIEPTVEILKIRILRLRQCA